MSLVTFAQTNLKASWMFNRSKLYANFGGQIWIYAIQLAFCISVVYSDISPLLWEILAVFCQCPRSNSCNFLLLISISAFIGIKLYTVLTQSFLSGNELTSIHKQGSKFHWYLHYQHQAYFARTWDVALARSLATMPSSLLVVTTW